MKSNNNRLKYMLAAAMLTGMVTMLVWMFSSITVSADNGALDRLQAENSQLRQTLAEMQARENTFRTQIQKANETIFQLIEQPEPTAFRSGAAQSSQAVQNENATQPGSSQQTNNSVHTEQKTTAEQERTTEQPKTLQDSVQSLFSFGHRNHHEEEEHEAWEHSGG